MVINLSSCYKSLIFLKISEQTDYITEENEDRHTDISHCVLLTSTHMIQSLLYFLPCLATEIASHQSLSHRSNSRSDRTRRTHCIMALRYSEQKQPYSSTHRECTTELPNPNILTHQTSLPDLRTNKLIVCD